MIDIEKTTTLKHYSKAFAPALIWATTIFILSAQGTLPGLSVSVLDFAFKKSAHMFVYAVLYMLLWYGVQQTTKPSSHTRHWLLPLALTLTYALVDEFHQSFVPGRFGTIRDIGYDMLGAGIVFLRQYRYI